MTIRGRGFMSAGLSILGCGLWLDQRDLTRLACLVLALPLLSMVMTFIRSVRVSTTRSVLTPELRVNEPSTVRLVISNDARRLDSTLGQETIPAPLGASPRFSMESLFRGESRAVTYTVRPSARGHFELGPLVLTLTEPLGLALVRRRVGAPTEVLVYPQVVPLSPGLVGASAGLGDDASSMSAESGNHALSVREYRHGDDLRRIHWRSTARLGELMVRADEQAMTHRATVLLDNRFHAYRHVQHHDITPFEWAVSMAASICHELRRQGYEVTLVTQDATGAPVAYNDDHLDVLALLPLSRETVPLARLTASIPEDHGPLLTVCGSLPDADVEALAALGIGNRVLMCLGQVSNPGLLTAGGWLVSPVGPSTGVGQAWAQAVGDGMTTQVAR